MINLRSPRFTEDLPAEVQGATVGKRIYVASSWRNERQPAVVRVLRSAGHEVYDFRNPVPGKHGFAWSDIGPDWQAWKPELFREALDHPLAEDGFTMDMAGLAWCNACLLLLPCGGSAHLEFGWACGSHRKTIVLLAPGEPELMYKMASHICVSMHEVLEVLRCG